MGYRADGIFLSYDVAPKAAFLRGTTATQRLTVLETE